MERDSLNRALDHLLSAFALLTRLPLPDHRPAGAEAAHVGVEREGVRPAHRRDLHDGVAQSLAADRPPAPLVCFGGS